VIDRTYLPFTPEELSDHFVATDRDHLAYYLKSVGHHHEGDAPSKLVVQIEKDERFWILTALKRLFDHADSICDLVDETFKMPPGTWAKQLGPDRRLYFEVALPAPKSYLAKLKEPGALQALNPSIPHLQAAKIRARYEGRTSVDAVLVSSNGAAVLFEAKVLSDISYRTTWDSTRNQIARNIDVMLEHNPSLLNDFLRKRDPDKSCFVLVTDEKFKQPALKHNRLFGWLMDEYCKSDSQLLAEHLDHRNPDEVRSAAGRIGWTTWQQMHGMLPGPDGACPWIEPGADDGRVIDPVSGQA
jgi:hypothetical protein